MVRVVEAPVVSVARQAAAPRSSGKGPGIALAVCAVLLASSLRFPVGTGIALATSLVAVCLASLAVHVQLLVRRPGAGRLVVPAASVDSFDATTLPTYTVIVNVQGDVPAFAPFLEGMARQEYPSDRLQVVAVVDPDARRAVDEVRAQARIGSFEVVVLTEQPGGAGWIAAGLRAATGDIVALYAVTDHPEPLQLRRAAMSLGADADLACVQTEVAAVTPDETVLSAWSAAQGRAWYRRVLPGIGATDLLVDPVTSLHVRRSVFDELDGADLRAERFGAVLGVHLRRHRRRAAVLDSVTARPVQGGLGPWMRERARWYRACTETWLARARRPRAGMREMGVGGFLRFSVVAGGTPLIALLGPVSWGAVLMWFVLRQDRLPGTFDVVVLGLWIVGTFVVSCLHLAHAFALGVRRPFLVALASPVYWLLSSVAATAALAQLVFASDRRPRRPGVSAAPGTRPSRATS